MRIFLNLILLMLVIASCSDDTSLEQFILAGNESEGITVNQINLVVTSVEIDCHLFKSQAEIDINFDNEIDFQFDFDNLRPDLSGECCPDSIVTPDTTIIFECSGNPAGYKRVKIEFINSNIEFAVENGRLQKFDKNEEISTELEWSNANEIYFENVSFPNSFDTNWSNQTEKYIGLRITNEQVISYGWIKLSTTLESYDFISVGFK